MIFKNKWAHTSNWFEYLLAFIFGKSYIFGIDPASESGLEGIQIKAKLWRGKFYILEEKRFK